MGNEGGLLPCPYAFVAHGRATSSYEGGPGSIPGIGTVAVAQAGEHQVVALKVSGSIPDSHPSYDTGGSRFNLDPLRGWCKKHAGERSTVLILHSLKDKAWVS